MIKRKIKLGLVAVSAVSVAMPLLARPAFADYAPSSTDAVGVGSDTVQYASDFIDDGDYVSDTGYNALGNFNRVINFDATPDANARLAYAANGVGTGQCAPGTGGTAGTGGQTGTHADSPCTLNPTIVLRAGLRPVQRPNGSGAGGKAGAADSAHYLDYVRASSCQGQTTGCGGNLNKAGQPQWDDIEVGQDPLQMLQSTTPTSNAVPLTAAQLNSIYSCTTTTWNQVGGASTDTIIPIIPQVGSGTRSSFLGAIGNPTLGGCVKTAEENDPLAIGAQSNPADAIEPMSGGRLNLFLGRNGSGTSIAANGYFQDPSCPVESSATGCPGPLAPAVGFTPAGTPSGGGTQFGLTRPLFIYFRDADIHQTAADQNFGQNVPFQPGGKRDLVRELFYNPCSSGETGCVTIGGVSYGPGGKPYYATSFGQTLISAAGISPSYVVDIPGL